MKNSNFTALISPLTPNTFVLVVTDSSIRTFSLSSQVAVSDSSSTCVCVVTHAYLTYLASIASQSTLLNMNNARTHFTNVFAQLRASENLKASGTK